MTTENKNGGAATPPQNFNPDGAPVANQSAAATPTEWHDLSDKYSDIRRYGDEASVLWNGALDSHGEAVGCGYFVYCRLVLLDVEIIDEFFVPAYCVRHANCKALDDGGGFHSNTDIAVLESLKAAKEFADGHGSVTEKGVADYRNWMELRGAQSAASTEWAERLFPASERAFAAKIPPAETLSRIRDTLAKWEDMTTAMNRFRGILMAMEYSAAAAAVEADDQPGAKS